MNDKRNTMLSVVGKICLLILVATLALLAYRIYQDALQRKTGERMRDAILSAAAETLVDPTAPPDEALEIEANPVCAEAYAQNSDFIAALQAGEDTVLYVVQGEDNDFYMNHDFYGNYSQAGSAFLDCRCSLEPRDTHFLIHGHNMRNGAVFGDLDSFRKLDYLKKNSVFTFAMMYETEYYVPYAILDISSNEDSKYYFKPTEWNFDTEAAFAEFIEEMRARSFFDIPVELRADDALLTLSTCSYNYDNGRLLVACRRLRTNETPEEMRALMQQASTR